MLCKVTSSNSSIIRGEEDPDHENSSYRLYGLAAYFERQNTPEQLASFLYM